MKLRSRTWAMLTALGVLAAGCVSGGDEAGASVPGVTATTVTVGGHLPLTGPAAPGLRDIAPAIQAYFDYVNDRGGINGRKLLYNYKDDAYNPTTTVDVVHKLVEQDKVFAILAGLGTPTHTKVVDYLNAQHVPDLFVASGCTCWDDAAAHPYTFGWQLDYVREGKILGTYVKDTFPGKNVAYFTQNDAFGKDGVKGLNTVLPSSSVVSRQTYQPGTLDVTPQMTAIAQAKADVIVVFGTPVYTAQLRLAQQRLGNTAQLVVNISGADPDTLSQLLDDYAKQKGSSQGNSLIQGLVTDIFIHPVADKANSWIALFEKVRAKYAPDLPRSQTVFNGIAAAYTFAQALQQAGKNPTRQSLVDAVEKGRLTSPGLTPYTYSKTSHAGFAGSQIATVQGDALVPQGQPVTTDSKSGPVTPYTQSPATAPADGLPTH